MNLTTHTDAPTTITLEDLELLESRLGRLIAVIDDDQCVPERFSNSTPAALAALDAEILTLARAIVQRLDRTLRFPTSSDQRYFALEPGEGE